LNDAAHADPEFRLPVRVYIEDTDAGGIVFYVNYLKYFERARTEFMRRRGFAKAALLGGECMFVVHSMEVEYLRAAQLDDELEAGARLIEARGARLVFAQRVLRGADEICRARITVACVDSATRRPCVLPRRLREALAAAGDLAPRPDTQQQSMEIPT
jgi:4-hydroxybenzoyl-CoA thioesterase